MGIYMNPQVIQEAYFGKTPGIQKCFNAFCKFRNKYVRKSSMRYDMKINTDPDLLAFNRCMEEEFGFDTYSLNIGNANIVNAYTFPIGGRYDIKNPKSVLVSSKNGFKYKKEADLACVTCIYTGLLCREEFTNEEVFAILLHEIGHNFEKALSKPVTNLSVVSTLLDIFSLIIDVLKNPANIITVATYGAVLNNKVITTINKITETINKNKIMGSVAGAFLTIKGFANDVISMLNGPMNDFTMVMYGPAYGLMQLIPINWPHIAHGYGTEKIADSFATIYGYGPELSSALLKFKTIKGASGMYTEVVDSIPVISQIRDLVLTPSTILIELGDAHPNTTQRVSNNIKTLESELSKGHIDPKMKKRIQADITEIKTSIDKFDRSLKDTPLKHHKYFSNMISMTLYKSCGGDLREDIIEPMLNTDTEIDTAYKEALPINKVKLK